MARHGIVMIFSKWIRLEDDGLEDDGGSVNAFLAAALARVMRVAVPIPAVTSASVFHSAACGGSVVDVVRPL